MIRYCKRTPNQTYVLMSGIESWLEPDPYFPRLFVKRPEEISESFQMLDINKGEHYEVSIEKDESLFLDDILFNFFGDQKVDNDVKLKTIEQLKEKINHIDNMIKSRIENELFEAEQEALYEEDYYQ